MPIALPGINCPDWRNKPQTNSEINDLLLIFCKAMLQWEQNLPFSPSQKEIELMRDYLDKHVM